MKRPPLIVLHLTIVHSPADIRIYKRECRALVDAGFQVVLLAPTPASGCERPGADVRYRELPHIKHRLLRILYSVCILPWRVISQKASVYHLHDPELIPLAILLKIFRRKVIWDVHEDTPAQIMYKYYLTSKTKKLFKYMIDIMEHLAAKYIDVAVCATPAIAQKLTNYGIHSFTVQNFPIKNELLYDDSATLPDDPRVNVVYVGGITLARGAIEMVRAMGFLPQTLPCNLLLAGPFGPNNILERCSQELGWDRVQYLGNLPRSEVIAVLKKASIGLVVFHPLANHINSQPNKIFEYMSAGLPVIASNFPLWRELITGNACGLNVDPLDPIAIANAIEWLLLHSEEAKIMGARGRFLVREKFNWSLEVPTLLKAYDAVLHGAD